jgi:AAA domain
MADSTALPVAALRAACDPATFDFKTTDELEGLPDATASLGQGRAEEALCFGLTIRHPGYHVFVLGEHGTGRHGRRHRPPARPNGQANGPHVRH